MVQQPPKIPGSKADAEREARLAEALRANLRRRKAQARGRRDTGATGTVGQPPDASDGGEFPDEGTASG